MSVLELEEIEKYDVVTAIQVHHYLSEKDRKLAVEKCCRALNHGGLFFTFENVAPDSEIGRKLVMDRWKSYQIRNGKDREEAESHIKRYDVDYFPLTVKAHLELMRECGFQAAELYGFICSGTPFFCGWNTYWTVCRFAPKVYG